MVHAVQNEFVSKNLIANQDKINTIIEHHIGEILERVLVNRTASEKAHISECLAGDNFFNLTDKQIPKRNPMCVPDVKLKQFMFTLKKMKTKLGIT